MENGFIVACYSAFFFLMDLCVFGMAFFRRKDSDSQKAFCKFALSVLILQFFAFNMTAFELGVYDCARAIKGFSYFVVVASPAVSAYFVCGWLTKLFSLREMNLPKWAEIALALPMVIYVLLCLVSLKTHWVFFMDEKDVYHQGSLYVLQLAVPYFYLLGIFAVLVKDHLKQRTNSNGKIIKFILLYTLPPIIGSGIQTLLESQGNFSSSGVSAALLLCYIGMYMGDAEEQRRLKDLADFNDKLQLVNKQLRTTMMLGELQAKTVAESIRGGFKISLDDKQFSLKYVSDQFAKMLGYTVDELMAASGGTMAGLVDVESARSEIRKARHKVDAGEMFVMNFRMRCKDGSWKHVEERGRLIKNEDSVSEFWSVVIDKDEQVRIETAFAEAEKSRKELAEYSNIISTTGLGIWFVTLKDGAPGLMHGDKKLYELMGIDGDSMSWEDIHEFLAGRILPEDLPVFGAAIDKMKQGQFAEALYRWKHPTKGVIYNRCGGTAVRAPDGSYQLSGYHGDATEIVMNERKQQDLLKDALAAAEESSRAKTTFLNNMSHDIRTPMNAILGFANLIERDCENPELLRNHLKKLKSSGDFLLSLINNVLEMARIESGKYEMEEVAVNLQESSALTATIFDTALKEQNLTLSSTVRVTHEYVYVDIVKMREIIINLISNAIKYSKKNGHINVSLIELPQKRDGYGYYEFVVEDDGIGMSESYLPHLFDSFERERNSTESKIVGTGLGLPIVKKLLELMGGTISVESALGKGTKFTLLIEHRLCMERDIVHDSDCSSPSKVDFVGKRILLAEDNDLNAEIAENLLTDAGFKVERATDGCHCIELLNKASADYYDIILMDILMPCMDGYETTRRIRKLNNARKDIPIVAMTANAFDEDRRAAMDAGMNGHVAKPINMDVLLEALKGLFK